jgi:hypothetical protein
MVFGKKRGKSKDEVNGEVDQANEEPQPNTVEMSPDASAETLSAEDREEAAKGAADAEAELKRNAELEAKYPHVVAGSLRHVPKGEEIDGTVSKGKMATIECVDCGSERTVNAQDLFQVKRCRPCTEAHLKRRQQERRAARRKKKTDDGPVINDTTE